MEENTLFDFIKQFKGVKKAHIEQLLFDTLLEIEEVYEILANTYELIDEIIKTKGYCNRDELVLIQQMLCKAIKWQREEPIDNTKQ